MIVMFTMGSFAFAEEGADTTPAPKHHSKKMKKHNKKMKKAKKEEAAPAGEAPAAAPAEGAAK